MHEFQIYFIFENNLAIVYISSIPNQILSQLEIRNQSQYFILRSQNNKRVASNDWLRV